VRLLEGASLTSGESFLVFGLFIVLCAGLTDNSLASILDWIEYGQFGILSPDGKCKPFDAGADGYVLRFRSLQLLRVFVLLFPSSLPTHGGRNGEEVEAKRLIVAMLGNHSTTV
jgi:hypothetical protein